MERECSYASSLLRSTLYQEVRGEGVRPPPYSSYSTAVPLALTISIPPPWPKLIVS